MKILDGECNFRLRIKHVFGSINLTLTLKKSCIPFFEKDD